MNPKDQERSIAKLALRTRQLGGKDLSDAVLEAIEDADPGTVEDLEAAWAAAVVVAARVDSKRRASDVSG